MAASRYLGLHTNYDKEASIRKTSVSLPVKLSCVAAWLEQSYLFLMFPLERGVHIVCLSRCENDLEYPFQLEKCGILLKAAGMKSIPYY